MHTSIFLFSMPLLSLPLLSFALPGNLTETRTLTARQTIPSNYLYEVESFVGSCGDSGTSSSIFYGLQEELAACTAPSGFDKGDSATTVRFTFPDDGSTYGWKLYSGANCQTEYIIDGNKENCVVVPVDQTVDAFIVFTE